MFRKLALAAFLLMPASALAQKDQSVDNALKLCAMIDHTGLAAQKCEVSGWQQNVVATIAMSASEARELCTAISGEMRRNNYRFREPWTLNIKSPYSGENSIAFCPLH